MDWRAQSEGAKRHITPDMIVAAIKQDWHADSGAISHGIDEYKPNAS